MTFRFFGDSWLWTWYPPNLVRSESLSNYSDFELAQSHISQILRDMGHDVVNNCVPGRSFSRTSRLVGNLNFELCPEHQKPEIWIVFVSSDLRPPDYREESIHPVWDMSNKNVFLNQLDNYMLQNLNRIVMDVDQQRPLDIILVGGQSHMPHHVFDKREIPTNRVHLLSHCILEDLAKTYLGDVIDVDAYEVPRFTYECEFNRLYEDYCEKHGSDSVDPELILEISREPDSAYHDEVRSRIQWPDFGHLGPAGQVLFVDYLLKFCEDKGIYDRPRKPLPLES